MCWAVPEISFYFIFVPVHIVLQAVSSDFPSTCHLQWRWTLLLCPPPFTSVLYYCQWSPCRHTGLIRFQILRMVVRVYIKCNKNHSALRRAVQQWKPTQGHAKLFSLLLNTKTFCLSLTVSLCFTLCNCALQVWSTGWRSPTTPRNKHASESSLELSLKGYMILNSSNCNWGLLLSRPQRPAHFGVVSQSNLIWLWHWEDSCSKGNARESIQTHTMIQMEGQPMRGCILQRNVVTLLHCSAPKKIN